MNPVGQATEADDRTFGYTRAIQLMHWETMPLLLGAYPAAWMIDGVPNLAGKAWFIMLHRSFAITILLTTNKGLAHQLVQVHGWIALAPLALTGPACGCGALPSLWLKNEVLAGMLPGVERVPLSGDLSPGDLSPVERGQP